MRVTALLAVAFASFAAAQTSSSPTASSSSCDAQNILDTCRESIQTRLDACGTSDYECLCSETVNMLTCFNNCPDDAERYGYESSQTAWCNAASATASRTTQTASSTGSASGSTASATASASDSDSSQTTPTGSTATESSADAATGNAGNAVLPGSFGAVAGFVALVGALL